MQGKEKLGDPRCRRVNGIRINLKKCVRVWSGFTRGRKGPVADCYENGDEYSRFMKHDEFLYKLKDL
jgi:hypothetical protein